MLLLVGRRRRVSDLFCLRFVGGDKEQRTDYMRRESLSGFLSVSLFGILILVGLCNWLFFFFFFITNTIKKPKNKS